MIEILNGITQGIGIAVLGLCWGWLMFKAFRAWDVRSERLEVEKERISRNAMIHEDALCLINHLKNGDKQA